MKQKTPDSKTGAPGLAARLAAVSLVQGVLAGGAMLSEMTEAPDGPLHKLAPQARARAQSLAETCLRNLEPIDIVLGQFLDKTPPVRVHNIMRVAAAELLADHLPAHAVVDSAVRMARAGARTAHLAGMVNAVMRRVAVEGAGIWPDLEPQHLPQWLRDDLVAAYGEQATLDMEAAHQQAAALDLTPRDPAHAEAIAAAMQAAGQQAVLLPTGSIRIHRPGQISALPLFAEGQWWVQDAAAAIPARLLGDVAGKRVLDLCAAPGGKTMQLAAAGADVTAVDISRPRLKTLTENLARTGLSARIIAADIVRWQPDQRYDAILLDAPCTATGTIRRHPDLPFRLDQQALAPLVKLQSLLIDRALSWLEPGGMLVYCTCSLLPQEGEAQVADRDPQPLDANHLRLPADWIAEGCMLRIRPDFWPGSGSVDGFFAARLGA